MDEILSYGGFIEEHYDSCKDEPWFNDVLEDCQDLDVDDCTVSAIIGCIHEGLRNNFEEAILFFWSVFLINPLIAIRAYQETDLLLGKIDIYGTFKYINPIESFTSDFVIRKDSRVIYNPSVEYFLIFAIEALLQKQMNPEMLDAINRIYLGGLYAHDKEIMSNKSRFYKAGLEQPAKWITHKNLRHILNAIDPHHIIILLEFFADRYGARLRKGNVGKYCYSKDKYDFIIRFIQHTYGSLSEYIEWDNNNYNYHYKNYYRRMMQYPDMKKDIDYIFATEGDKARIAKLCR